jgi:hypothetical protein
MQDLTSYSPIRVALTGIWRMIFGALLAIPGIALIWIGPNGEPGATRAPGDMPVWWMFVVGLVFAFAAFSFITGGVGRIISAFAQDCYFRAGPEGMTFRLPRQGWFGRYRLTEYAFRWNEIKQLMHFTHSLNLIPVSRELQVHLFEGKPIIVQRYYFKASVKSLQERLLTIAGSVGR